MKKAVCLVSGGLDSCVAAACANREGFELAFLHVGYGQRTEERERSAFHAIGDFYGVEERLVTSVEYLHQMGGSSLTDDLVPVPEGDLTRQGVPNTYVPFRNANLLAIAASWAEVLSAAAIFIGVVEEDSSGYPDCRKAFVETFNKLIELGTRPETNIEIVTPLIHMRKSQIVTLGTELEAPLEKTWSCYSDGYQSCGCCDSCLLRLRGFEEAGLTDPLPYRTRGAGFRR